jgi:hypothetical protein
LRPTMPSVARTWFRAAWKSSAMMAPFKFSAGKLGRCCALTLKRRLVLGVETIRRRCAIRTGEPVRKGTPSIGNCGICSAVDGAAARTGQSKLVHLCSLPVLVEFNYRSQRA